MIFFYLIGWMTGLSVVIKLYIYHLLSHHVSFITFSFPLTASEEDNFFLPIGGTYCYMFIMKVEGPKSPEEMLVILQRVLEESAPVLVAARLDAEERRNNMRLREEQDAAFRAALEADQVCNIINLESFFLSSYVIFCGPDSMLMLPLARLYNSTELGFGEN